MTAFVVAAALMFSGAGVLAWLADR